MKKDLQSLISSYIASYRSNHPYSPTIREIAEGTAIPRATVGRIVKKMRATELLDYSGHRKILLTNQNTSNSILRSIPAYLTEEAYIRSSPNGAVTLPSAWLKSGEYLLFTAPENYSQFGIHAGDPILVQLQTEGISTLPLLCQTPNQHLRLVPNLCLRNKESFSIIGTVYMTFRILQTSPTEENEGK